jgi:hypothetical protein
MNWNQILYLSSYTIIAVAILVQSVTLAKLIRSGNYKSFVRITAMLLLANIAGFLSSFIYSKYSKNTTNYVWLTVYSLNCAFYWGLANIADWHFSFEYYNMVRIIPFVLDEIPPP